MKRGSLFLASNLREISLFPLLFSVPVLLLPVGCSNSQRQAGATLPAASLANYPSAPESGVAAETPTVAATESSVPAEPEPFSLRRGENLVPHKVGPGDTLSGLAARYKTSIKRIQAANALSDTTIYRGKTYQIPTRMSEEDIASLPEPSRRETAKTERQPSTVETASSAPSRPTFAPAIINFSGPSPQQNSGSTFTPATVNSPEESVSVTIPPVPGENGSGSAFPTPTFGGDSSF